MNTALELARCEVTALASAAQYWFVLNPPASAATELINIENSAAPDINILTARPPRRCGAPSRSSARAGYGLENGTRRKERRRLPDVCAPCPQSMAGACFCRPKILCPKIFRREVSRPKS